jgi:hypothetical protein
MGGKAQFLGIPTGAFQIVAEESAAGIVCQGIQDQ